MNILRIRPAPRGGHAIAYADVEVCDGIKLFGLRVDRKPDQTFRVYSPNAMGGRTSVFSPAAVEKIARAVVARISEGEPCADERLHR